MLKVSASVVGLGCDIVLTPFFHFNRPCKQPVLLRCDAFVYTLIAPYCYCLDIPQYICYDSCSVTIVLDRRISCFARLVKAVNWEIVMNASYAPSWSRLSRVTCVLFLKSRLGASCWAHRPPCQCRRHSHAGVSPLMCSPGHLARL